MIPATSTSDLPAFTSYEAPIPGEGAFHALWLDETTLAWPPSLLPPGVSREVCEDGSAPLIFGLVCAPEGGARTIGGVLDRGPRGVEYPLVLTGALPQEFIDAYPALSGYLALSTMDEFGEPRLARADVEDLLTGQVAVVQRAAAGSSGWVTAFTGVQIWPLIDTLWGQAAAASSRQFGAVIGQISDAAAPLPAASHPGGGTGTGQGASLSFALWAPTARQVRLHAWNTGEATGNVPLIEGEPLILPATRESDGTWVVSPASATTAGLTPGCQYLWEVTVWTPAAGAVVTTVVTDPYSRALTTDSRRSVAVDLSLPGLEPEGWKQSRPCGVRNDAARSIYELHVRDFSAADGELPEDLRGTYAAFGAECAGTRHLRALAQAGLNTVHLLPTFDFSSVPEDRAHQRAPHVPPRVSPASRRPQAVISHVADEDAYNWGYDPWHWLAPEGSYARSGHQDGGARVAEFRTMVGALHGMGLGVVLDAVFNHTAGAGQDPQAVLDRIVPGYYHRLDAAGHIEHSTCCNNVATERAMAERLMIDACVAWVRDYHVDGFRFDLMGYHSVGTMARLREAVRAAAAAEGLAEPYLYGEGWNMGEVADNRLFLQATQGQVGVAHIGTFNDRVRDALTGSTFGRPDPRQGQGWVTAFAGGGEEGELAWQAAVVRASLAGNLRSLPGVEGLRYGAAPVAYGEEPASSLAYVDAHDDETLYDRLAYKLPPSLPMEERLRAHMLALAAVTLGQSPCFWAAGTELLRSKSLDGDSYNSGDWFNAIDFTGQRHGWGRGLPPAARNFESWIIQAELLVHEELRPTPPQIAWARGVALDLLRLRHATPLLTLGSARLVRERVSFPAVMADGAPRPGGEGAACGVLGQEGPGGLVVMVVDDGAGAADIDPLLDGVMVALNPAREAVSVRIDDVVGRLFRLHEVQREGADERVRATHFDPASGTLTLPGQTAAVLVE